MKRKSKYNASKIEVDGHRFDSKKEYKRFTELCERLAHGEITNLRLQVSYDLIPTQKIEGHETQRAVKYVADFVYEENGETVVEDVKGYRGGGAYAVFKIKKKLMYFVHHLYVREV